MTSTDTPDERDGGQPVKRKPDSTVDDERDTDAPESDGGHDRDERVSLHPLSPEEALRALLNTEGPKQARSTSSPTRKHHPPEGLHRDYGEA